MSPKPKRFVRHKSRNTNRKMDKFEKGLRELVRKVIRNNGIRHRSINERITTICYAQHPDSCIEYQGPIIIGYDFNESSLIIEVFGISENNRKRDYYDGWYPNCDRHHDPYRNEDILILETARIDIARPDMSDMLSKILNKYITNDMKRPKKHKKLITKCPTYGVKDGVYKYFVENGKTKKRSKLSQFFDKFKKSDDFAWEQALKRHFKLSEEELEDIKETVKHIQSNPRNKMITETDFILKQGK